MVPYFKIFDHYHHFRLLCVNNKTVGKYSSLDLKYLRDQLISKNHPARYHLYCNCKFVKNKKLKHKNFTSQFQNFTFTKTYLRLFIFETAIIDLYPSPFV